MFSFRKEYDVLGEVKVPSDAYYGAFTKRALDNFQISGTVIHRDFIETLALIKKASAFARTHSTKPNLKDINKEESC